MALQTEAAYATERPGNADAEWHCYKIMDSCHELGIQIHAMNNFHSECIS
jgi:hypothetical protein